MEVVSVFGLHNKSTVSNSPSRTHRAMWSADSLLASGAARAKALRKPRMMTDVYCILDIVLGSGSNLTLLMCVGLENEGGERRDSAGRQSWHIVFF